MAYKDIRESFARLQEQDAEERSMRRARMRHTLQLLFRRSLSRRDYRGAGFAVDRLCRLDGLYEPDAVHVTQDEPEALPDFSTLSTESLELLSKLLESVRFGAASVEVVVVRNGCYERHAAHGARRLLCAVGLTKLCRVASYGRVFDVDELALRSRRRRRPGLAIERCGQGCSVPCVGAAYVDGGSAWRMASRAAASSASRAPSTTSRAAASSAKGTRGGSGSS